MTGYAPALLLIVSTIALSGTTRCRSSEPVSILTQPFSVTAALNSSVTFSVTATGSPPITYQWFKNSSAILSATGSSYTITNVQITDGPRYDVVVSNSSSYVLSGTALLGFYAYEPYLIETLAGNYTNRTYKDGTNKNACFSTPNSIVVDQTGDLYMTDADYPAIRKISASGTNWITTTIAGSPFSSGTADGTNADARFSSLRGIAIATNGTLYVTDRSSVRQITHSGTNWAVTTIASGLPQVLGGPGVDSQGPIFFPAMNSHTIYMLSKPSTNWIATPITGSLAFGFQNGTNFTATFKYPENVVIDSFDNIYVSDWGNGAIRKLMQVATNWVVTTAAGSGPSARFWRDGPAANAMFTYPEGIAADPAGNIFVGDYGVLRKITPTGFVTTCAGNSSGEPVDGLGQAAGVGLPFGLAADRTGVIYIADGFSGCIARARPACGLYPPAPVATHPDGFIISGFVASGLSYRLQYSTNTTDWTDLTDLYADSFSFNFVDANVPNDPIRYYHLVSP